MGTSSRDTRLGRTLRVLVTGSGGLIGGVLTRTLGDKYALSGLDRVPPDPAPNIPMRGWMRLLDYFAGPSVRKPGYPLSRKS